MKKCSINVYNTDEFIKFINKYNYYYRFNINIENRNYILLLLLLFNENTIYGTLEIIDILTKYLNNDANNNKNICYQYWKIRGYSFEEYKQIIIKKYKKTDVYFNADEILQGIITNNKYEFNLNNIPFIRKFINFLLYKDFITDRDIYTLLRIWCNNYYPDVQNKGYIKGNKLFYISRGYSENEAISIIKNTNRKRSQRSVDYFLNKGYTLSEAKKEVSNVLKKNSSFSKSTTKYWEKLGLSKEEAKEKASYYAKERSVWTFDYWERHGYSKEEAIQKVHSLNPSCVEYKEYNTYDDYLNKKKLLSNLHKNIWHNWKHSKDFLCKIKGGWLTNISNEENLCFEFLLNDIDANIIHEPYIVIIPDEFKDLTINNIFYACDGYLKYKNKIIIFEYDGGQGVFHQLQKDLLRDKDILMIDENILGIIRIAETVFKHNDYKNIINYINESILKIKDCKESRVVIE